MKEQFGAGAIHIPLYIPYSMGSVSQPSNSSQNPNCAAYSMLKRHVGCRPDHLLQMFDAESLYLMVLNHCAEQILTLG